MNNVAFFVTGLDSGGLENYLLRFLNYKASCFDSVFVFCKGGKAGQLEKKYTEIPNVIIHTKKIGFYNPFHYIYVYRFIKKNNINIVCDFTGNFAGLVLNIANWSGIKKRVVFYRGSNNHFKETKLRLIYNRFMKWLTYKNATNILSNSKAALNFFYLNKWENDDRFQVIYNGIDAKSFTQENENLRKSFNIPEDAFIVGHTGRYNIAKNHNTILKVAIELCQNYEDIYFIMCGNGVKDNLKTEIQTKHLSHRIILSNNRSDIPKFLNTMDCFYFPSISEGQPNALIEAMVSNLPIVASNIESIKETVPMVLHDDLIDPYDYKAAIINILKIKQDQSYSNKLKVSDLIINQFSPDKLFTKFYLKLSE